MNKQLLLISIAFCVIGVVSTAIRPPPTDGVQDPEMGFWDGRGHLPRYTFLSEAVATEDSIFVFHEGGKIDWWELDGENAHLKRQCSLPNAKIVSMASVMPESKIAVFARAVEPTRFSLYDISKCISFTKLDIGMPVSRVESAENKILVGSSSDVANYILSWTGRSVTPIPEVAAVYDATISRNGLVAYREQYDRTKLRFFDTERKTELPKIKLDFEFAKALLTPSGSYVALQDSRASKFVVYDVNSQAKLFDGSSKDYGNLQKISDDGRSAVFMSSSGAITIVTLDLDGNHVGEPKFVSRLSVEPVFASSLAFRDVNGAMHLQTVSKTGVLRLYKMSEAEKTWNLV